MSFMEDPLAVKLAAKLLFEILLGLHGVVAIARSSESIRLQGELTAARETIEELCDALFMKEPFLSSMIRTRFGHIDPAGLSGVKEEPTSTKGLPPGFSSPANGVRKDKDNSEGGLFPKIVNISKDTFSLYGLDA
ncbi:uncharacterized protein G2W53_018622 [Senna tora]|uniref:Uncharacterized protein n=1 Tax=Senna tora TaxID=362788 RepID=A0A834TS55_9FABA|nr:uncharacterized protein G2W53_018622 [Senna tora]